MSLPIPKPLAAYSSPKTVTLTPALTPTVTPTPTQNSLSSQSTQVSEVVTVGDVIEGALREIVDGTPSGQSPGRATARNASNSSVSPNSPVSASNSSVSSVSVSDSDSNPTAGDPMSDSLVPNSLLAKPPVPLNYKPPTPKCDMSPPTSGPYLSLEFRESIRWPAGHHTAPTMQLLEKDLIGASLCEYGVWVVYPRGGWRLIPWALVSSIAA